MVTNFVLEHMLDLAKDNSGVIMVYQHIKKVDMNDNYYPVNKMLSFQHYFKQISYNYNTIEL